MKAQRLLEKKNNKNVGFCSFPASIFHLSQALCSLGSRGWQHSLVLPRWGCGAAARPKKLIRSELLINMEGSEPHVLVSGQKFIFISVQGLGRVRNSHPRHFHPGKSCCPFWLLCSYTVSSGPHLWSPGTENPKRVLP